MNSSANPSWILMIFLVLLVFGAIAAIIWRSWIVGGIVLGLVVLMVGLYSVSMAPRSSPSMVMITERSATLAENSESTDEILKTANIYPSLQEAAKYAALRIYDSIKVSRPALQIKRIRIVQSGKGDDVRPEIARVLQERYPNALIVADDSRPNETFEMTVTATIDGTGTNKCLGVLAAQEGRNFRANTCVQEAPWFSNIDGYSAENPDGKWILGRSSEAEISPELAREQARRDAAAKLVPFAINKFPELSQDPQWLRNRLERELEVHNFIKDNFLQQLNISLAGGTTWRAGVLVDAGTIQLEQLHLSVIPEFRHRSTRMHRFGGGLVGMGVLICLVYLFLNRATRGYFQMNLRLAATMALVAGALLILLITS